MVYVPLLFVLSLSHLTQNSFAEIHVRIKNELSGDAMKIKLHCQDGDQSLGAQTIAKGMAIEWRIKGDKAKRQTRNTPYACNVEWNETDGYHFEAYSEGKYNQKCQSACTWHVTEQGPLLQNQKTGSWEAMPFNPLPDGKKDKLHKQKIEREDMVYGATHVTTPHKCICWPPKPEL